MRLSILGLIAVIALGCEDFGSKTPDTSSPPAASTTAAPGEQLDAPMAPDNTGLNARDADGDAMTPFDQGNTTADIAVTADIRKQIVATSMSISAQNVKVMTQEGKVTLRGPVANEQEKAEVERIADAVAGAGNVVSELQVANK
ncbi:MAG: BON domain-containing protein [Lacipirellulaceae bacterium]